MADPARDVFPDGWRNAHARQRQAHPIRRPRPSGPGHDPRMSVLPDFPGKSASGVRTTMPFFACAPSGFAACAAPVTAAEPAAEPAGRTTAIPLLRRNPGMKHAMAAIGAGLPPAVRQHVAPSGSAARADF